MSIKYPELFSPFSIGKCKMKNRIVMAPMGVTGITEENGKLSTNALNYYEERAKGGAGLIISCCYGNNAHVEQTTMDGPFDDPYSFGLNSQKLVDRIHQYGCKLFFQIAIGAGRISFPMNMLKPPVAPSPVGNRWVPDLQCRELTREEIQAIIEAVAQDALMCKKAGADGVEIHSVYGGYLGDQFAMSIFNHRTDEYGGDLRGRLKVACDIVKRIKELCGKDYPVSLRFGAKHYMKGIGQGALPGEEFVEVGRDIDESIEAAKILEEAGYDALNIANGSYDSWYWAHPPMYQKDGCWLDLAAVIRKNVNIPVMCAGKINLPEMANDAIKNEMVDAIVLGRALLADPYWPEKANEGKDKEIRPCIACHTGCMARIFAGKTCTCAVNPAVGREAEFKIEKAPKAKNVCIIGCGVAGMEAARVAALRGHHVTIYEKLGQAGGALIPASVPEFKDADRRLIKWYENELEKAGVKICYHEEMTVERVRHLNPDVTILATGAKPKTPPVPGVEKAVYATDVLMKKSHVGKRCVIIGGGQVGCEIGVWLTKQGKEVTIVEALDELVAGNDDICIANRLMLIDMVNYAGIDVKTGTMLKSIDDDGVTLTKDGEEKHLECDSVILSVGFYADRTFYEELSQEVSNVWFIGDQNVPTNVMNAVAGGAAVGFNI